MAVCFVKSFYFVVSVQLPPANSVALDMSLQTPSDVKVKEEEPVEVDSSPPGSPESLSGMSDSNQDPIVKGKVINKHHFRINDEKFIYLHNQW